MRDLLSPPVAKHRPVTLLNRPPWFVLRIVSLVWRGNLLETRVLVMVEIRDLIPLLDREKEGSLWIVEGFPGATHTTQKIRPIWTTGGSITGGVPALPTIPLYFFRDTTRQLHPWYAASVMTEAIIVLTVAKLVGYLFTGRSGSGFDAESIRAEEAVGAGSEEIYVPEWTELESLGEEKNTLMRRKTRIEDLKSQLLRAREESAEVTQLRAQVSGLEATENSLRGEVASAKDHNILLEQECDSLKLKVTGLESAIVEKDHELSELGASSSSLKSQNQSLVDQLSNKKDASTWDIMDLLRLDDAVAKTLDVFVSIDDPLSAEALIEPPAEVPATNVLSTVVIVPHGVIGKGEGKIDAQP
ncbi:hypothetical protein Tco_0814811 [Tanacetum coccineum]